MEHKPVLKQEIVDCFSYLKSKSGVFLDCTLGLGGHSLALKEQYPKIKIVGIDQDNEALDEAKKRIKAMKFDKSFTLVHDNFVNIISILEELKITSINGALIDLGVSSLQLDKPERGFSFKDETQPLDMRMDQSGGKNAADILNSYPKSDIERILKVYGEEFFAHRIAENIALFRAKKTIRTVGDILTILSSSIPFSFQKKSRTHFATKTFQALRIEVNNELANLNQAILDVFSALKPGSRLAIISFHSLEDRIVKETFKAIEKPCQCPTQMPCICGLVPTGEILTRKPRTASDVEVNSNPRSRSAKLRIIEKL